MYPVFFLEKLTAISISEILNSTLPELYLLTFIKIISFGIIKISTLNLQLTANAQTRVVMDNRGEITVGLG